MAQSDVVFDLTSGPWQVVATWSRVGPDAVVTFLINGDVFRSITYPAYKVWNIAAHLDEIVADFEEGMAAQGQDGS